MQNNRQIGMEREKKTAELLTCSGYKILEKNFRCRSGEVDLIALHQNCLVFIEVKYRKNEKMGYAAEAVSYYKQKKISRVADYYIQTHCTKIPGCRFDVVAWDGEKVTIYENAFEYIPGGRK